MNNYKKQLFLKKILIDPSQNIPPLSRKEAIEIVWQAISDYQEAKISFDMLIKLTQMIQKHCSFSPNYYLVEILKEISSYCIINDVLTDMLDELKELRQKYA